MMMSEEAPEMEGKVVDGSQQLAVEIRAQRELAMSNPRDIKRAFANIIAELSLAPEFAAEAYYSITYGEGTENETKVEGLSVKASRATARLWGNCAVKSRVISEDHDHAVAEGLFVDFETNVFIGRTVRVPKTYIKKGSAIPVPYKGVHLTNAIQAGLSKAERNATLAGLPEWFKERVFAEAVRIAGSKDKGTMPDEARLQKCFESFGMFGVLPERVKVYADKVLAGKTVDETIGSLRGVWNALKEGQARVEEVFPTDKPAATGDGGKVKLGDIPGAEL
jgi:hypothetical protein